MAAGALHIDTEEEPGHVAGHAVERVADGQPLGQKGRGTGLDSLTGPGQ